MAIIEIRELDFSYPECSENALENISLTIENGEFFVLCGASGSGKSTLLRQLKTDLAPHGTRTGEVLFHGEPLDSVDRRTQSAKIGFVSQSPDNQIVTDKVWHELAFGLESLGYSTPEIRGRVAEMAAFFGIEKWFHKSVTELSGGQKQLLNLASVMTLRPDLLILDEPTSQLDPIAAGEFLGVLKKVNSELGVAVIITEHRLEEALPLADRVGVMEHGKLICTGDPREVGSRLKAVNSGMFLAMPTAVQIWAALESKEECPLTVAEGRNFLRNFSASHDISNAPKRHIPSPENDAAVSISEAWFRYEKDGADVIRGLDLTVKKGEFLAILGGNGAGKTTTLKLISGLKKAYRGEVNVNGKISALPQNPQALFVKKTVREDILELADDLPNDVRRSRFAYVTALCRLDGLLDRHPYDLSGGEQQRAALAKILMSDADILLLDEPTKGLDPEFKALFGDILNELINRRKTLIMVSHDVEFCAEFAHRCAMFFDGSIVTEGTPTDFFGRNSFYTTSASRISRDIVPDAVTVNEVILACRGRLPERSTDIPELPELEDVQLEKAKGPEKLPFWRKLSAVVSGAAALFIFLYAAKITDLKKLVDQAGTTALGMAQIPIYIAIIAALSVFAASLSRPSDKPIAQPKRSFSRRSNFGALTVFFLVPLTLFIGVFYLGIRRYYAISLAIMLECSLPFFIIFERRRPQARELVTIATLCAIGIAGRAAFFMLPQFKPVAAVVIISGIALGGETGFLVGAVTMLTSNILFSQGPWTPFQMFAMGMIGFLAGVFSRMGFIRRTRVSMCIFGAISVIVVYGGIMDPASALTWSSNSIDLKIIITYYITGFPMNLVHAAATVIFLWFGAEPMLEKIDRVKVKFGLME